MKQFSQTSGTKLEERLKRGDKGINKLDEACKTHDIEYSKYTNSRDRYRADRTLVERAFKRIYSSDSKLGERAAAVLVTALMGAKMGLSKIGLGLKMSTTQKKKKNVNKKRRNRKRSRLVKSSRKRVKRGKRKQKKKKSIAFGGLVKAIKTRIKRMKSSSSLNDTVKAAIRTANKFKRNKHIKMSRVLKIPKFGGNIKTIVPILTGLSAVGSIAPTTASIIKTMKEIRNAKNVNGERKIGRGLNLLYNASGSGFYLKPAIIERQH